MEGESRGDGGSVGRVGRGEGVCDEYSIIVWFIIKLAVAFLLNIAKV